MRAFIRRLPDSLWNVTIFVVVLAFFTQIAISLARSGAVPGMQLVVEFVLTVALLCIPVALAWIGKQRQVAWYSLGALVVLLAFARVFFF
jgi:hypothetical protein